MADPTKSDIPSDYTIKRKRVTVGYGPAAFEKASDIMLSNRAFNSLDGVQLIGSTDSVAVNSTIATYSRVYNTPLWTLNPCRIINSIKKGYYDNTSLEPCIHQSPTPDSGISNSYTQNRGHYSEFVFATLKGHLIAGEEACRVYTEEAPKPNSLLARWLSVSHPHCIHEEDKVIFELVSYSKGCGILGKICMPVVRPLQDKFMLDYTNAILRYMRR